MSAEAKEWVLEPETEYRFELDPGTSVAVKVSTLLILTRNANALINTLAHPWACRGVRGGAGRRQNLPVRRGM